MLDWWLNLSLSVCWRKGVSERLEVYKKRLDDLIDEFIAEKPDPHGQVYGLFTTLFLAPQYLQGEQSSASARPPVSDGGIS